MADREPCTLHGSLIEGQATIATELAHLKEEIRELKIILRGSNGISGIIGWFNQRMGEIRATARTNGFVAGLVGAAIVIVMRAVVGILTK